MERMEASNEVASFFNSKVPIKPGGETSVRAWIVSSAGHNPKVMISGRSCSCCGFAIDGLGVWGTFDGLGVWGTFEGS
jgi:hypothetical protein